MKPKLSPPYRTVITLQDLEFGGTQRYALHLLNHLNRDFFDLELWVLREGAEMLPMAQSSGVPVTYISHDSWVTPRALWNFFQRLKSQKPDVLYTMTSVPNIWGRIFSAVINHSIVISSWRGRKEQQFESILWRFSDRIICNAQALKEYIIERHGVDPKRVAVVPNGVDTKFFTPSTSGKSSVPTVTFVGRLVKEKDPLSLIQAFSLLRNLVPGVHLIMVGQGYMLDRVRERLASTGLSECVEFVPGSADVRPFLRKSWIFVLPSISEGFPQVILEAMSSGLPVVATHVGGVSEIVQDGVNGLLVEPRDPEKLAKAMAKLLLDDKTRNHMSQQARSITVERYSLDRVVKMTEEVILEAISERAQC